MKSLCLQKEKSGHLLRNVLLLQILGIIFVKTIYAFNIDSIRKSIGKELTPDESAVIIKKEHEKLLNDKIKTIANNFTELDSIGYTKEIFQYINSDSIGGDLYKKVKIIQATYKHKTEGDFYKTYYWLEQADLILMSAISCTQSYYQITKRLLPNKVPQVTGELLHAYANGEIYDSAASLYSLFRYHLGVNDKCKAYSSIIKKVKADKNLSFILKYSNSERFYYYIEDLSVDSLIMVFNEIHSFDKRELGILEKWDEECTLKLLFSNLFKYYQKFTSIKIEDLEKNEKLKYEYQKLLSLFKNKSTLDMFKYWDVKFSINNDKTIYPEVKKYIEQINGK
jgi:hypothetical protein